MISLHLEVAFHFCKTIDREILPKDCSSLSSAKSTNEFKAKSVLRLDDTDPDEKPPLADFYKDKSSLVFQDYKWMSGKDPDPLWHIPDVAAG